MKRIRPPEDRPEHGPENRPGRRKWAAYVSMAGGLLFVSGILEAVFAHSVVLLTAFLAWILIVSLLGYLFGLWN